MRLLQQQISSATFTTHQTLKKARGLNNCIVKYAPKDRTYSMTNSLSYRVHVAIGANSIGHHEYWRRVFAEAGVGASLSTISVKHLKRRDATLNRKRKYQKRPERKAKRQQTTNDKIRDCIAKETIDSNKGISYGSGKGLEDEDNLAAATQQKAKRRKGAKLAFAGKCPHCNLAGHERTSSKNCRLNPKHLASIAAGQEEQPAGESGECSTCSSYSTGREVWSAFSTARELVYRLTVLYTNIYFVHLSNSSRKF